MSMVRKSSWAAVQKPTVRPSMMASNTHREPAVVPERQALQRLQAAEAGRHAEEQVL